MQAAHLRADEWESTGEAAVAVAAAAAAAAGGIASLFVIRPLPSRGRRLIWSNKKKRHGALRLDVTTDVISLRGRGRVAHSLCARKYRTRLPRCRFHVAGRVRQRHLALVPAPSFLTPTPTPTKTTSRRSTVTGTDELSCPLLSPRGHRVPRSPSCVCVCVCACYRGTVARNKDNNTQSCSAGRRKKRPCFAPFVPPEGESGLIVGFSIILVLYSVR